MMGANQEHVRRTVDRPSARRAFRLWFVLLGGALAWSVHFMMNYLLVTIQCVTGWLGANVLGVSVLLWLIMLMTLIALGITAWSFAVARCARQQAKAADAPADGYGMYMARGGLWMNGLFMLLIVLETLPIFFLRPCG